MLCHPEFIVVWDSVVRVGFKSSSPLGLFLWGFLCCHRVVLVVVGFHTLLLGCRAAVLGCCVGAGLSPLSWCPPRRCWIGVLIVGSPVLLLVYLHRCWVPCIAAGLAPLSWSFPPSHWVGLVVVRLPMSVLGCPRRPGALYVVKLAPSVVPGRNAPHVAVRLASLLLDSSRCLVLVVSGWCLIPCEFATSA